MAARKKIRTLLLMVATVVTGAAASIGFASAAYLYNQRYQTPTNFNTNNLTAYFEGGIGTTALPFLISTPDHLRNLQKLNVLGVFSEDTNFRLSSTIPTTGMNWSGSELLPIGTEDYPFYSQFDGNGKRINNLVVLGSQTNDIGMFGYVATSSNIKNFVLSAPTVYVTNDNNSSNLATTNPLDPVLKADATSLSLTLTQKSGAAKAYFVANKTTVTGTNSVVYNIEYKSSNTDLLFFDVATSRWIVNTPVNPIAGNYYPVQLAAKVYGMYQDKIISYTLERWQINITDNGNVNIANTSTGIKQGFWKTLNDIQNVGLGVHGTYVGFFIGHLDGEATNLGLYGGVDATVANNAKLYIRGRKVSSYTTLIGRSVNDNSNDDANAKFVSRAFEFDDIIRDSNNLYPAYPTPSVAIPTTIAGLADSSGTQYTNYNNYAKNVSKHYGVSDSEYAYIRYYPELADTTYAQGGTTYNMLNINGPLSGYLISKKVTILFFGTTNVRINSLLKNGIWISLSADNPGSGGFFSTNSDTFEVKIKVRYVATGSEENRFQLMYTSYYPGANIGGILPTSRYSDESFKNLQDLQVNGESVYDASNHSIIKKDELGNPITGIVEQDIEFIYTKTGFNYTSNYDLLLGLGVGRTWQTPTNVVGAPGDAHYMSKSSFDLNTTGFSLKILSLDLFFTSVNGNISRQISNVDFLYSFPTFNAVTQTWTDWPRASNVRINFDVVSDTIYNSGQYANYRFYRSAASGWFTSSTVYGIENRTQTAWNLKNTSGYANGSFSTGTW